MSPPPHTRCSASVVAAVTVGDQCVEAVPGDGGLEGLDQHPQQQQRLPQVRSADEGGIA